MQRIFDSGKPPENVEIRPQCGVCGSLETLESPLLFNFDKTTDCWFCSNCFVVILQKRIIEVKKECNEEIQKINDSWEKTMLDSAEKLVLAQNKRGKK